MDSGQIVLIGDTGGNSKYGPAARFRVVCGYLACDLWSVLLTVMLAWIEDKTIQDVQKRLSAPVKTSFVDCAHGKSRPTSPDPAATGNDNHHRDRLEDVLTSLHGWRKTHRAGKIEEYFDFKRL